MAVVKGNVFGSCTVTATQYGLIYLLDWSVCFALLGAHQYDIPGKGCYNVGMRIHVCKVDLQWCKSTCWRGRSLLERSRLLD